MEKQTVEMDPDPRYKFESFRGKGSYGVVGCFLDLETKERVAIKKMQKIEDLVDARRLLREIMMLQHFRHPNILELKRVICKPTEQGPEIYLVTQLMDSDLNRIIRKSFKDLTDAHLQYIFYQIFRGLQYLHSGNVIHRDIKPSNILSNEDCDVVMCDFGFARDTESSIDMTEYVITRFYRAPEVMLSSQKYSKAVDIWSIGCTMYEMLTGKPLFQTKNYLDLIKLIINTLGKPSEIELEFISNAKGKEFILGLPDAPPQKISAKLLAMGANPQLLDLIDRCMEFNPQHRLTAEEAMRHPYFASLFEEKDIVNFKGQIDFQFDSDEGATLEDLHRMTMVVIEEVNRTAS